MVSARLLDSLFYNQHSGRMPDLKYVTNRLLENPGDFANALKIFYSEKKADKFKKLLTEHLKIGGDLVNADKDMNTAKANELRKKWYANADEIAEFFPLSILIGAKKNGEI